MTGTNRTIQAVRLIAFLAAAGTEVCAESASRRIVVSIPDRKLVLLEGGRVVKMYRVAVGKSTTPSPSGAFHIVSQVTNPTYYHEGKAVGPGPMNPVGTRWMGLGYKGYGIHGTNVPGSIGKAASHGCIRMRNHDVEELFGLVQVGDPVELVAEPDADLAKVFAEAEPKTVAAVTASAGTGGAQ
jgi:lipoprotein-anchoring transpeptidase ErfK/SrfK